MHTLEIVFLAFIGFANIAAVGYYAKLSWQLYQLHRQGENGLTLAMAIERSILSVIFLWSFLQSVQNGSGIVEVEVNPVRLFSLTIRSLLAFWLLVIIAYQDREMKNGSNP